MTKELTLRAVPGWEMNDLWQPDAVKWPENSFCICAYDENGKLKGRVGMIILPHMEGFWVTHDELATGLAQRMEAELLRVMNEKFGCTHALTFVKEKANGMAKTIEAGNWKDEHLRVFSKEIPTCQ